MTRQVNTRNGLFANEGWGGGVFNYNTAFGATESAASPVRGDHMNHHYGDVSNLNAPYDNIAVQGLGSVTYDGKTLPSTGLPLPWRKASSETLDLQYDLNERLASMDKCPLLLDGILGPRTCGAMVWLNQEFSAGRYPNVPPMVSTCNNPPESPMMPTNCPQGEVPAPPPPEEEEEELEVETKAGGIPFWVWGLGLGVLAVGAAMAMKKKRR